MTTKTKTKRTLPETLVAAETAHREQQTELASQAADLRVQMIEFTQQAEDAELAPEEIEGRWRAGEDVPVVEYVEAKAAKVKAEAMHDGAKVRLAALERKVKPSDKAVAEALVPVVGKVLDGVPVHATFAQFDLQDADAPVLVVHQSEPTTRRKDGSISAKVDLTYKRAPYHRELDGTAFEHAARALGFGVQAGQVRSNDRTGIDSCRLTVHGAYEAQPHIDNIDTLAFGRFAQRILQTIAGARRYEGTAVELKNRTSASSSHLNVWQRQDAEHTETIRDGKRTVTVTLPLLKIEQRVDLSKPLVELVEEHLDHELDGAFLPGLGVVADTTFGAAGTRSRMTGWSAKDTTDWTVTVTIESSLN